jgi:enoyl-CoA hydratase/carnithine racemase
MAWKNIQLDREGPFSYVTMNRPERRNALSLEHLQELLECFRGIGQDAGARVAILRANGPAFSAGHDLSEMIDREPAFHQQLFQVCTDVMETLHSIPQPVIAQVHGVATAAGCQLVAACDIVVAAEEARFATPGVKVGLFCSTPMVEVSRSVGLKKTMEMLLTGELISAQEAQAAGLVNRIVPKAELAKATKELAEKIAGYSASVIALGKRAFYQQLQLPRAQAYGLAQEVMCSNAQAPDAQEGMRAFLQKRPPKWK